MPTLQDLFSKVYRRGKDKELYVLGIMGSPRDGGNSDILLDRTLEVVKSSGARWEKINLCGLSFSGCFECDEVTGDGSCKIADDMQLVYSKIQEADVIILACPVFFGSLNAQTKLMIDRFQCLWRAKNVLKTVKPAQHKKSGAFICVQASQRKEFFENSRAIVKNFFATVDTEYRQELSCPGVDEKAGILKHPEMLRRAFELGQRVVNER
ncbi:MAG: flavodoxin family protein [Candidatus Omnitrophica bacterium]|nr:flavodoxin family protein [Candidatus Omnitrophota bacterium]